MSDQASRKFQKEINSGAVSLVVLAVLECSPDAMYGYEIARILQSHAGENLPMNQGAVYPVLRSLEKQGLLNSRQLPSSSGPPRRYYSLTSSGEAALSEWTQLWNNSKQFVDSILENTSDSANPAADSKVSRRAGKERQAKSRRST